MEDICGGSAKELAIEIKLKQLMEDWVDRKFVFSNFKTRGPVILAGKELCEIMEALEESHMVLGGMASNRYSAPFREEVTTWIKNLSTCTDVVEQWVQVQNLWIYMEVHTCRVNQRERAAYEVSGFRCEPVVCLWGLGPGG